MNIFASIVRTGGKEADDAIVTAETPAQLGHCDEVPDAGRRRVHRRTGRTEVYAVRVRECFKSEILGLQAELKLERQKASARACKVTQGEIIELMLEAYEAARRHDEAGETSVPLAKDVWDGVHELARRLQIPPAEIVEELVVHKITELGLLPRKRA